MLMGDFNGRSEAFGDSTTTTQGRRLESWILNHPDLVLLNDGSITRPNLQGGGSVLDLTITSPTLAALADWSTSIEGGSDHNYIAITIPVATPQRRPSNRRWDLANANWPSFVRLLRATPVPSTDLAATFSRDILNAAELSIPTIGPGGSSRRPKSPPWWTGEFRTLVRRASALKRTAHRTGRLTSAVAYNEALQACHAMRRTLKRDGWRTYASTLTHVTPLTAVWKKVKWFAAGKAPAATPIVLRHNGALTSDPLAIGPLLSDGVLDTSSVAPPPFPLDDEACWDMEDVTYPYNDPITLMELNDAIRPLHNSAPGEDTICNAMLRHMPTHTRLRLWALFNAHWLDGTFPDEWKQARILPFLKPGKPPEAATSYRPIALLDVLGKLFERILHSRLQWWAEQGGILQPSQSGFRRNRCTIDNLVNIVATAQAALRRGDHCCMVFMDLRNAFGSVHPDALVIKLRALGLRGRMLLFLRDYLANRKAEIGISTHTSAYRFTTRGVPQGSVLSPLLFTLFLSDLRFDPVNRVRDSIFADDLAFVAAGTSQAETEAALQVALNEALAFTRLWGLDFQPSKCQVLTVARDPAQLAPMILRLGAHILDEVASYTYLGLVLDQNLSWRPLIQGLLTSVTKRLALLRSVAGQHWGADRFTLRLLYRQLIRSKIDYVCNVYASAAPKLLRRLDILERAALRSILGVPPSTSIGAMHSEANVTPLAIRREVLAARFLARCAPAPPFSVFRHTFWTTATKAPSHSRCAVHTFALRFYAHHNLQWVLDSIATSTVPTRSLPAFPPSLTVLDKWLPAPKAHYSEVELRSLFLQTLERVGRGSYVLYTDGSIVPGVAAAGAAVIAPDSTVPFLYTVLPGHSISRVELYALYRAVQSGLLRSALPLVICSDSSAALASLRKSASKDPLVLDTLELIRTSSRSVTLLWTPEHAGIGGNVLADAAAGLAISDRPPHITAAFPYSNSELSKILRHAGLQAWSASWQRDHGGRLLFSHRAWPPGPPVAHLQLGRHGETLLARLHCDRLPTLAVLHRFQLVATHLCSRCAVPSDIEHLLFACPVTASIATPLRAELRRRGLSFTLCAALSRTTRGDATIIRTVCGGTPPASFGPNAAVHRRCPSVRVPSPSGRLLPGT